MSARSFATSRRLAQLLIALLGIATQGSAHAELLTGKALLEVLRQGGYVLVMRHANSPPEPPDANSANADNPQHERQLDNVGRELAQAMGASLKKLHVPIGEV